MSTYDAYNLSLRDSTEFTVPTGGSGGNSDYELVDVTFINNSNQTIAFNCPFFVNDPQYESVTGFAKNIVTECGLNGGESIALNMLIPTGGAVVFAYGPADLTVNATGDIRIIVNQLTQYIVVYGSGTATFSGGGGK